MRALLRASAAAELLDAARLARAAGPGRGQGQAGDRALHLAVRDASGEPILELRADSPEWWDFGAVTVLHTPDGRLR